ncbi:MAG: Ldh family oxidoreductase [Chromatiales bacterium]|jgi:LDH2 family malate/lactate/ureidoglycolate dehydrogenase
MTSLVELTLREANDLVKNIICSLSMPMDDKNAIIDHIIEAESRGYSSHGLIRVLPIVSEMKEAALNSKVINIDSGGFLFLDGGGGQGIAVITRLLQEAFIRLESSNAIVIGASNYIGTTGCLGLYGMKAAKYGYVAIQTCHSIALMAPSGAIDPVVGTNPLTISLPGTNFPFVADISTSVHSHGWARIAKLRGETIPDGVIQDRVGNISREPEGEAFGSMLPMSGYKGFALALASELICGPVLGGKAGKAAVSGSDSYFAILIKANAVRPLENVLRDCDLLFEEVLQSTLKPGADKLRIPGERASKKKETIFVPRELYDQLKTFADRFH